MIPPGSTLGVLGGGQLGRMLALDGRRLGYRFAVFEPSGPCPAGSVADLEINAPYDDLDALRRFAGAVDIVTLEFENIPAAAIETLAAERPVMPGAEVLRVCQHRQREKDFLAGAGFPCAPFRYADSAEALESACGEVGLPCVVKTAAFGYDGKGQVKLEAGAGTDFTALWDSLGRPGRVVVEKWIHFEGEYSVVVARNAAGESTTFPVAANDHRNHILHESAAPSGLPAAEEDAARDLAVRIADALGVVGLLAVELFRERGGGWIVNEMAPRPHNSGHYTLDACATSQFEQHVRAVCGLPFGSVELLRPAVMVNLLGDLWAGGEPDWRMLLGEPGVHLHLYGKASARPGRKMGHFTVVREDRAAAAELARRLFDRLSGDGA